MRSSRDKTERDHDRVPRMVDGRERRVVPFERERLTLGSSPANDVVIAEPSVSRIHAVLQLLTGTWFVEDCGSRNGTYVNGTRVASMHPLRTGDDLRVGRIQLRLAGQASPGGKATEAAIDPPALTGRERDVLVALCAPLANGDAFTEPASVREIAALLVVSDATVKQHLAHLYDKFDVVDGPRRRSRLANVVLDSAAVTLADIRSDGSVARRPLTECSR